MGRMIPSGRKLVAAAAAVGALSLGTAGLAGAAAATSPTPAVHINCDRATKALSRIEKAEARIAAGLPRLTKAEARAAQAGHRARSARIHRLIARLESTRAHTRLTRRSAAIEAACHVAAPAA